MRSNWGAAQVDSDGGDVELLEVEVEARQVLRSARRDHGKAVEPVRRRVVREREVVVLGVVATVALQWEVRVADARPTRLVAGAAPPRPGGGLNPRAPLVGAAAGATSGATRPAPAA